MYCCNTPMYDEEAGYQLFQYGNPPDEEYPENIHIYFICGKEYRFREHTSIFLAKLFNLFLLSMIFLFGTLMLFQYGNFTFNIISISLCSFVFTLTVKSFFD